MYYLDGEVELTGSTRAHQGRKKSLARLLELWALERDVELNSFGSWTLTAEVREAGAEPDECYILGPSADRELPDLVIEVEWSRSTGLPRDEIYRRLGVRELWTLRSDGRLLLRALDAGGWMETSSSKVLPELDVPWLVSFLDADAQSASLRAFRDALRAANGQR